MGIPVLSVRDNEGNIIPMPAIKGDKGDKGDSYNLTDVDKQEIADMIAQTEIGDIETALDSIIAIQNSLIGGDSE